MPLTYHLMSARRHDVKALAPAVKNLTGIWLVGNQGYVGKKIHQKLKLEQGIKVIIPKRQHQNIRHSQWEPRELRHRRLMEVINEQLEQLRVKSAAKISALVFIGKI
jgi:hypothetical protein